MISPQFILFEPQFLHLCLLYTLHFFLDDGTFYFDEKLVDARGHQGPLSASASVVRGITAFAAVTTENLNVCFLVSMVSGPSMCFSCYSSCSLRSSETSAWQMQLPGEKVLGLAKFFLGIGIPGSAKDLYYQIDALSCLESIRQVVTVTYFFFSQTSLL